MDIAKSVQKLRKQVAGLSLVTMIASLFVANVATAGTYTDVPANEWFYTYVEQLAAGGILDTTKTTYRPGEYANRAEAVKLLVEAASLTPEVPASPSFKDVAPSAWYYQYVETAVKNGFVSGYADRPGYFGPGDNVTREQFAKMAMGAMNLTEKSACGHTFPDVTSDMWSYKNVMTLYCWSVVDGYPDGTFGPTKNINRAEIAKMVVGAMNPSERPDSSSFMVSSASATSLTMVDVMFSQEVEPNEGAKAANYSVKDSNGATLNVTAATVSGNKVTLTTATQTAGTSYTVTVSNVMSKGGKALTGNSGTFKGYQQAVGGDITVSLNTTLTPGEAKIPAGASGVQVLAFDVQGGSAAAVINGLTFKKTGLSNNANILNVFVYQYNETTKGIERLTSGKSINSTNNTVTFSALNLDIPASTKKTFLVVVDLAFPLVGSDNSFGFDLTSADMVMSNAKSVGGTFPIQSAVHDISATAAGQISVEKFGTISDPQVGAKDVEIGKFKLVVSSDEGAMVKQLAFLVDGSIAANAIENARLLDQDGKEIAKVATVNSKDLLVFTLSTPYVILKGDTRNFTIKADLNTGRNNDTIKVYVEENTDVIAEGDKYHFGMRVVRTEYNGDSCDNSAGKCSFSTVKGGDVTISFGGPTAGTIAKNGKDVKFLTFTITTLNNITVDKLSLRLDNTSQNNTGANLDSTFFSDPQLKGTVNTANTFSSPTDTAVTNSATCDSGLATDDCRTFVFADQFNMSAGQSETFNFTMDVENNSSFVSTDNYVVTLVINTASSTEGVVIKDANNKVITKSTQLVPTTDIVGKPQKIDSYSLTVAYAGAPAVQSAVIGSDIVVSGLNFTAGTAGDVKITDLTLGGYVDAGNAPDGTFTLKQEARDGVTCIGTAKIFDQVSSVSLWDTSVTPAVQVGATKSFQATDGKTPVFNGLNWTVPAGLTKTLQVKFKLNNVVSNVCSSNNERVGVGIATPNTEIVAQDPNGNSVTISNGATELKPNNTDKARYLSLEQSGNLSAFVEGQPNARIQVSGSTNNMVNKYRFHAVKESFIVKKLTIANEVTTPAVTNQDAFAATSSANLCVNTATGGEVLAAVNATQTIAVAAYSAVNCVVGDYLVVDTNVAGDALVKITALPTAGTITVMTVSGSGTVANSALAEVSADDSEAISLVTLKYKNSAGADEMKTGALTGGVVTISGLDFMVGKDADAFIEIYSNITDSSTGGADMSGKPTKLGIAAVGSDNNKFEAVGQGSSNTINTIANTTASATVASLTNYSSVNRMVVRKSVPTFTQLTSSDTLSPGENTLYAVKVAADAAGSVSFGRLVYDVSVTNTSTTLALNNFKLYRGAQLLTTAEVNIVAEVGGADGAEIQDADVLGELIAANNGTAAGVTATANYKVIVSFNQEESVTAGQNIDYLLKATVAGAGAGDAVNVKIATGDEGTEVSGLSAVSNGNGFQNTGRIFTVDATNGLFINTDDFMTDASTASTSRNVIWSDKSSDTHAYPTVTAQQQSGAVNAAVTTATGSTDWTNGYLLKVTNLASQSLSF